MNAEWPFVIIRNFGTGLENKDFLRMVFDAQRRHPGLVEEIWFCGNRIAEPAENERLAKESLPYRDTCRELGIKFSYQQGITLNHAPDWKKREQLFSENAWAVAADGRRCYGLFCANSDEARDFTRNEAELFLSILQPDSYWPDDDLRMAHKGLNSDVCFCERCVGKFNREYGHEFTRETLADQLFGEHPSAKLRAEWTEFNGKSLAAFAAVFREAVDRVLPSCRLGIQTVYSHWRYDGPDYRPVIEALAGPDHKPVGVRPGAGYYAETKPRQMLEKALCVGEEAERCKRYGFVGQLCYEAENWPHVSAEKSPEAQMIECALMLASGMDSLALYRGSDKNGESDENYAFYFDTLARYKPFFHTICKSFAGTHLAGGAVYHGQNALGIPEWTSKDDQTEVFLMTNSVPVVRESGEAEFFILNERAVRELAEADLPVIFAKPVLADVHAFRLLAERFATLKFTSKVRLMRCADLPPVPGDENFEHFEGGRKARNCDSVIVPTSPDVRPFSRMLGAPDGAGTCLIPTEFGGSVILFQFMKDWIPWTGYRRKVILDALDSVRWTSVRLLTGGYAVSVTVRKDDATGKTAGVFLLNTSVGSTPALELAIRNPAHGKFAMILPESKPVCLQIVKKTDGEIVVEIPPLRGWQPALITGQA